MQDCRPYRSTEWTSTDAWTLQEVRRTATPLPKWQGQRLPLERTGGGRLLWPPPEGPTASSPQGLASGPSACYQAKHPARVSLRPTKNALILSALPFSLCPVRNRDRTLKR